MSMVMTLLNSTCEWRGNHGLHTFLIAANAITLDSNWFEKIYSKESLEKRV
jgi:hypothetical protein